ncbi:MAG: hypothetical protein HYY18_03285, partial [Planctomycetes bacterium]|nr:hypothetical protein [Planctomycetota bacterium]
PSPARLVIGDAALRALGRAREEIDLAGAWFAWTGLPFVFAAWVTLSPRPGLSAALAAAAREGRARRDAIAAAEATRLELDAGLCRRYLRENMRFTLGEEELAGVERFRKEAAGLGLVPDEVRMSVMAI